MEKKDSRTKNPIPEDTATKDIATKGGAEVIEKATAVPRFIAFETSVEDIRETLTTNLGEDTINDRDLERIKIPAGGGPAWIAPDISGDRIMNELPVIILMWSQIRTYWKLPMEESEGNMPPDCFSPDARRGFGSPGGDCLNCRFAQFGSDPKSDGQACKLVRQLFVLREENILPEIVSLPASSIKPSHLYFQRLAVRGVPCYGLISRIGLEKAKNPQGIVYSRATFTAGELLPRELAQRAKEYAAMLKSLRQAATATPIVNPRQVDEGEVI